MIDFKDSFYTGFENSGTQLLDDPAWGGQQTRVGN
jgi:hypothetical protein